MATRNSVTTNASRQMQNATPHRHWKSNELQRIWQKAAATYGPNSEEATVAFMDGVIPPSILTQFRDQALAARKPAPKRRTAPQHQRPQRSRSSVLPPELLKWAVQT